MNVYHNSTVNRSSLDENALSLYAFYADFLENDKVAQAVLSSIQIERQYGARDTLFREGDEVEFYYFIQQGNLKGYKLLTNGREQIIRFILNRDFVLFPAMDVHNYSAEVLTKTDVILYPKYEFDRLIKTHNVVQVMVFNILKNEISASQQQILLLGRMAATERVSTFLHCILEKMIPDYADQDGVVETLLPMTRADIADYLGLTIETVSRVFSKLRKDKIIGLPKPNRVQFYRPEELKFEKSEG